MNYLHCKRFCSLLSSFARSSLSLNLPIAHITTSLNAFTSAAAFPPESSRDEPRAFVERDVGHAHCISTTMRFRKRPGMMCTKSQTARPLPLSEEIQIRHGLVPADRRHAPLVPVAKALGFLLSIIARILRAACRPCASPPAKLRQRLAALMSKFAGRRSPALRDGPE